MSSVKIAIDWKPNRDVTYPEDATVAELEIRLGDDPITRHRVRKAPSVPICETVYGPVVGIVDWLIENWSFLFWETQTPFRKFGDGERGIVLPGVREWVRGGDDFADDDLDTAVVAEWQHRHLVGHASSDLALPSMVIVPELHHAVIVVDGLPGEVDPSVEFLDIDGNPRHNSFFVVRKTEFEAAFADLIERTIQRYSEFPKFRKHREWLKERWTTAQKQEADPRTRLNLMLGDVSASSVLKLQQEHPETAYGLQHLLVDCPIVRNQDELAPVQTALQEDLKSNGTVPRWSHLGVERIPTTLPAFQQGYRLARLVRRQLTLGTRPLIDFTGKVLRNLDVTLDPPFETLLFRTAVCAPRHGIAHILRSSIDPRMEHMTSVRFAITAALGRLLWSSSTDGHPVCAAHGDYARLTQTKRANAFAAEFLLPSAAIKADLGPRPSDEQVSDMAERYGISRSAARWHVRNADETNRA